VAVSGLLDRIQQSTAWLLMLKTQVYVLPQVTESALSFPTYPQRFIAEACLLKSSIPGSLPAGVVGLGVQPSSLPWASKLVGVGLEASQGTAAAMEAAATMATAHKRAAEDRFCDMDARIGKQTE